MEIKDIEVIDEIFSNIKNVKLLDKKVMNLDFMKTLTIKCEIKNITSDFNIGIDLQRLYSKEQLAFIITGHIKNRILEFYGI